MADHSKTYHEGHRSRVRKRIMDDSYIIPDYEVVEQWLGYLNKRKDTKPLAKELLDRFGGIAGILDAHPTELKAIKGVGPAFLAFLTVQREIIARYFEEEVKKKKTMTLDDIGELARCHLAGSTREEVWAALLDNGNRLLTFERVNTGSVNHVLISPREAVELTLKHKASGLVLVHNHPGGNARPSTLDVETTNRLSQAMAAVGLRFEDHLIFADGAYYSLTRDRLLG